MNVDLDDKFLVSRGLCADCGQPDHESGWCQCNGGYTPDLQEKLNRSIQLFLNGKLSKADLYAVANQAWWECPGTDPNYKSLEYLARMSSHAWLMRGRDALKLVLFKFSLGVEK